MRLKDNLSFSHRKCSSQGKDRQDFLQKGTKKMRDRIIRALKELGIADYIISENKVESVELFFIRKRLDMRRMKDFRDFDVTVYRDIEDKRFRGNSTCKIFPTMKDDEIKKSLADTYGAAEFVKNPYFEMQPGVKEAHKDVESNLMGRDMKEIAKAFVDAAFSEDKYEDVYLNNLELFVNKSDVALYSSFGSDVSYTKWQVTGEFVVQCPKPQDVETYQSFTYDELDTEALKAKVRDTLEMTKARAEATKSPEAGKYRVIISSQYMEKFFMFYAERAHAAYVYPKYSNYEIGTKAQGDTVKGDKITMTLKASVPYSAEGIVMKDRLLLDKGEVKTFHGNTRFCYYLGVEPTGDYDAIEVEPGKVSFEDMKKEPYLYVVNFSDFQMDSFTGHFGGEFRLAFLFDGEKVIPVTHGSVSGNLLEVQDRLTFSSDLFVDSAYRGPFAVSIPDMSVAGE